MRILFVATALDRPESYLAHGLIKKGFSVKILLGEAGKHAPILESHRDQIDVVSLRSRIDLAGILKLRKILREFQPDIVHSLSGRGLSNVLLASWGIKVKHIAYRGTMGNLSYWDPASWMSFLHPRLNKIICVSNAVRDDLIRLGIANKKVIRIYKGHSPDWYQSSGEVNLSSFAIPQGETVISCVANSRPVKGIDTLIKAFKLIPFDLRVHLLLIGEVRDTILHELAKGDPRVHFAGFRKDAPALVTGSDIFCMPSRRREGFPKALIEAMIQGIPGVVTNVGGLPEIVIENESGFVVERDNLVQLSEALQKLVLNSEMRKRFGERAKQDVATRFSITNTIEETIGVYQEVLGD